MLPKTIYLVAGVARPKSVRSESRSIATDATSVLGYGTLPPPKRITADPAVRIDQLVTQYVTNFDSRFLIADGKL